MKLIVRMFVRFLLSCSDDKRGILDDGMNTLAYFRNDILKNIDFFLLFLLRGIKMEKFEFR